MTTSADIQAGGTVRKLRMAWAVGAIALQAGRWRAVLVFALNIFSAVAGALTALAMKAIADGTVAQDPVQAVGGAAALVVVGGIAMVSVWTAYNLRTGIEERARYLFEERVMELVSSIHTLEPHERGEFADRVDVLRSNSSALTEAIWSLYQNVSFFVGAITTALLLMRVHPALPFLPLFGIPSLWTGGRAEGIHQRLLDRQAEPRRRIRHLFDLATKAEAGKELRVFGLRDEVLGRHEMDWQRCNTQMFRVGLLGAALRTIGWVTFSIGYIGAIVFVARLAAAGRASPGDILLAVTLASRAQGDVAGAVGLTRDMLSRLATAGRYLWLVDYAAAQPEVLDPAPVPDRLRDGIRLEGVSFAYPGTETPVLSHVDLHIPAGVTVAIVGDNGAGKTTLVKLLARFYDPTSGRILIDGTDLTRFDPEAWRHRLSAGFQDFARFEFLARQTIGTGYLPNIEDADAVEAALDRAAGGDVLDVLPQRLETQLGRSFEGGLELSGGQWQKLALGRAMMREDPLILILDEPTASLDATTEHTLFDRYTDAARRAARDTGAVTVLVSHRFSTVRMADLILVVNDGRMVEHGSHSELMALGGLYAELYSLQARSYR